MGRGACPAAEPVSEEDCFSKPHCGRCRKPLSESARKHKALDKSAWYKVCIECNKELRACGGQDSKEVWDCLTAAVGGSGCLCCCADAKKQQVCSYKRPKSKLFSGSKKQKYITRTKNESPEGDE